MFRVVYRNDMTRQASLIAGPFHCLEDAAKARQVSGDIVVDDSGIVVQDSAWLWEKEKNDPSSYAHKCLLQRANVREIFEVVGNNLKRVWP